MPGRSADDAQSDHHSLEYSAPFAGTSARSFTGRAVDHGPFRPVPALIDEQVDRHPERPALSYDGRTLTYRRLDELTGGLAALLAERGIGRGDVVPVLLGDGFELPLTYLALMRLGAAFVPLDPAWPDDRLRRTFGILPAGPVPCADPGRVPGDLRGRAVVVDVDRITPARRPAAVTPGPDDLAYGFFTSGTTGTPKCAMNRQAGLTNRLRAMARYFGPAATRVVLQNSRHTFDSSLWQLFLPLTTGGHAVLPVHGDFLDLRRTIDTIAAYAVTATDFVSSVFNAMAAVVDHDDEALRKLSSLRRVIVGGEPLNPDAVHRLLARLPDLRIINGYGPTEASIGMAFHTVSAADGDAIPLGRPIDNCYAVVVDDAFRPVPPGVVGEIVIGGVCVGAGYLGDPEATARRFVANPFPEAIPADRLYRTGDLGHVDEEGRLFFSGRADFQVKIGGVRIELGEIAVAAEKCPGVRQAEVLVAEHAGVRSLALFAAGTGITEDVLRETLRRTLPRLSLPRHYFVLTDMPLNENGKADRDRLRAVLDARLAEDAARLAGNAPHTGPSGQVLRILRTVLGNPDLAAGADFMEAGGDSLLALSAVHGLTAECGVPVEVQDLYECRTAERLTGLIDDRRRGGAAVEAESLLMARDAAVPENEPVRAADPAGRLRNVLITGATGFVGSRLVHELLARTDLRVRCLVRAADDAAATARVVAALTERGLWEPRFAGRLEGYAGDLARPDLALDARTWRHLARTCDLVLHNGAMVNFLFDYRAHRGANVRGTAEVLRLAMAHRPVPLHHVSTLATLQSEALRHEGRLPERFDPARAAIPAGGYGSSKLIAERYLADARRRGALVTVLRLGEVMPGSGDGHPNASALTHLLLSSFARLGVRPDAAIVSDYTPVDYVAARVVAAVRDRAAWGGTFHVFHPRSVRFDEVLGPIPAVACGDFLARVREAALATGDRELVSLTSLLPGSPDADERTLQTAFAALLTDNPALFRKDECRRVEERWRLTDDPLDAAIAAYRDRLRERGRSEGARRPGSAGAHEPITTRHEGRAGRCVTARWDGSAGGSARSDTACGASAAAPATSPAGTTTSPPDASTMRSN